MTSNFDLHAENILYTASDGRETRTILHINSMRIPQGARVSIQGSSGAGKTTLIKVLSGIVQPRKGSVQWGKTNLCHMSQSSRDAWRGKYCGFLFQDFGLFEGLSAVENVLLPETFRSRITAESKKRACDLLEQFEVPFNTRAACLSRGEMQRTALARLLMGQPKIIFADEPTASLDETNALRVMNALESSAEALQATLLVITHDTDAAQRFPAQARMNQGQWQWIVPVKN